MGSGRGRWGGVRGGESPCWRGVGGKEVWCLVLVYGIGIGGKKGLNRSCCLLWENRICADALGRKCKGSLVWNWERGKEEVLISKAPIEA